MLCVNSWVSRALFIPSVPLELQALRALLQLQEDLLQCLVVPLSVAIDDGFVPLVLSHPAAHVTFAPKPLHIPPLPVYSCFALLKVYAAESCQQQPPHICRLQPQLPPHHRTRHC